MKNLYIFLFALLTINSANSQPCLPEGITFTTQEQIDNFQTNYPGCTEIEGDVTIVGGSNIFNLNGLNVLSSIGGYLKVQSCHTMTSLAGLENLTTIGCSLRFYVNSGLISLTGLNSLISIGGELYFYNNSALINLTGLNSLTSIGDELFFYNNSALINLTGLENLTSIGGNLYIDSNDSLTSLTGIDNIEASSISNISIHDNFSLSSCDVQSICNYLIEATGTISIYNNANGCNSVFQLNLACGNILPCPQNFAFSWQIEVDYFQTVYPGCTEIEGNVWISGADITNLNGLSFLTSIGGNLIIYYTEELSNVNGLENLIYIGGDIHIDNNDALLNLNGLENLTILFGDLEIHENSALTTLSGLENLNTIGGNLSIIFNDTLTGLTGMENLHYIGGNVSISDNDALSNLNGLETLDSIGGSLSIGNYSPGYVGNSSLLNLSGLDGLVLIGGDLGIYNNEILESLTGLENLTSVVGSVFIGIDDFSYSAGNPSLINLSGLEGLTNIGGSLDICHNDTLISLTGLENLTSIGSFLRINDNDALTNLTGLDSLTSIEGYIKIINNDTLNSLTGIDNIEVDSIWGIEIHDNPCLSSCAVQSICNFLLPPTGYINIYNNANGCDNPTQVANACGPAWPCFPEGITFGTQEEIDSFQINYPGCNDIGGSVTIVPDDYDIHIKNLIGLNGLTSIGGGLNIQWNDSLPNLSGLENLQSIGGGLIIGGYYWSAGNASLLNLSGLEGLTSINGSIEIINNGALTSLGGIDNIQSSSISDITICYNYSLSTCDVQNLCDYLSAPTGVVNIYKNNYGCNNPGEIANSCGFAIPCLPNGNYYFCSQDEINNFQTNYPGCTDLEGEVRIFSTDITNLNGLIELNSIGGNFYIGNHYGNYNQYLTNLTGLNNLISIGGNLSIHNNEGLTDLSGLENLTSINGSLGISYNLSLINILGLENLNIIGDNVSISSNLSLSSLAGLENIDSNSIASLNIAWNSHLSNCDAQSICNYLANPNGEIDINDNAPGCNNPEEVQQACLETDIEEIIINNGIFIYPNPSKDKITISLPAITGNTLLSIFNVSGEKVIERQIKDNETQINISTLPRGVYFVSVQDEEMIEVMKLIKQ